MISPGSPFFGACSFHFSSLKETGSDHFRRLFSSTGAGRPSIVQPASSSAVCIALSNIYRPPLSLQAFHQNGVPDQIRKHAFVRHYIQHQCILQLPLRQQPAKRCCMSPRPETSYYMSRTRNDDAPIMRVAEVHTILLHGCSARTTLRSTPALVARMTLPSRRFQRVRFGPETYWVRTGQAQTWPR